MLEERNQTGGHAHHLAGCHVDVFDRVGRHEREVAAVPGDDRISLDSAVDDSGVGRRKMGVVLLVGAEPDDVVSQLALRYLAIRRDQKAVGVDAGVDGETRDKADIRAFRRFDRADATVVRDVHVAHLEARSLAVQAAWTERGESPFVREHRKRIRLVNDLREFAAAEEVFNRSGDALGIDERPGRHFGHILQAHPLLHRAAQFQEALAEFITGEFVDRAQAAVAEVVDVIDLHLALALAELQHVFDRGDQVIRPERHLGFRHREPEFTVDTEATHAAEAIPIRVFELLVEQRPRLVQGGRITRPEPLVNPHQRILVARGDPGAFLRLVGVLFETVHQERHLLLLHHLDGLEVGGADQFGHVVRDLDAGIDDDLARALAALRIDDVVDGDAALDFRHASSAGDLFDGGLIEKLEDLGITAEFRIHRPQECQCGKLAALIDAYLQGVFFRDVEFDPAATLGNDATVIGFAVARLGVGDEIDAR